MKRLCLLAVLHAALATSPALARDTVLHVPLADALVAPDSRNQLDGSVKFYLAGAPTPRIVEKLGSGVSSQKANGVAYSDEDGCKRAILSTLIHLQTAAKAKGANAVVDIVSFYKNRESRSDSTIECHAGAIVIGAAIKGTFARTAE